MAEFSEDLEALLANAGWVHALGAELAGAGEAEDLVQEAWRVALERRASVLNLPSFLAGVVRNLAARARRGDERRRRRELSHARREAEPAADELVAEAELQRALIARVTRLAEPYRSTVLLHYYRGWSLEEIARAQGVPGATARTHLRRALARLRAELDRAHGGREAWSVAFTLGAPSVGGGVGAGSIGGGVIVGTKLKLAAAALIVALAGYAAWHEFGGRGNDSARAETIAAAPEENDPARPAVGDASSAEERAAASTARVPVEPASASAGVDEVLAYGSALDEQGKPVAPSVSLEDETGTNRWTTSQTSGSWSIAGVPPGRYRLRAKAEDHVTLDAECEVRNDRARQRRDLVLETALTLPIQLLDATGLVIARPQYADREHLPWLVVTQRPPTRADCEASADGQTSYGCARFVTGYEVSKLELAPEVYGLLRLSVPLPVFVSLLLGDELLETRRLDAPVPALVFTVDRTRLEQRAGSVRVRFVDATSGAPIAQGRAALDHEGGVSVGGSPIPADGVFTLGPLAPGPGWLILSAEGHAHVRRSIRVPAGGVLDLGDVAVGPDATVKGQVVDAQGKPISASVSWTARDASGSFDFGEEITYQGGRFELRNVPRASLSLIVRAHDHAILHATVDASGAANEALVLQPKEGVPVTLRASNAEAFGHRATLAAEDGTPLETWTLDSWTHRVRLAPGRYRLWTGIAEVVEQRDEVLVGDEPLRLTIGAGGVVR